MGGYSLVNPRRTAENLSYVDLYTQRISPTGGSPAISIMPCHRAIRPDGTLGGYQGGLEMKRVLPEMERILFDGSGRVVTGELYY
ncbi:MAG: MGMT family protein [Desulfobacteraceae bacterium]|nr:MGMT family protein [Desulfobacteraceae bacterium]